MKQGMRIALVSAGVMVGAVVLLGGGIAQADGVGSSATISGVEEAEVAITGNDLATASTVALESTGQGTVTDTEVGDEESYYEVEVTLDDGSEVDVQLDEAFAVVGSVADDGSKD